jgi:hypothetical protein
MLHQEKSGNLDVNIAYNSDHNMKPRLDHLPFEKTTYIPNLSVHPNKKYILLPFWPNLQY